MAAFPTTPSPSYSLVEEMTFKTIISRFDDLGYEQRKQKWLYPRRNITLQYKGISNTEAQTLWNFYQARGGRFEAFNWFHYISSTYTGEYVGTGDGSTYAFNCPSKQASGYTVYIDGAQQFENTNYIFTSEGGADGADMIQFIALVTGEVGATGDGTTTTFNYTLANTPVRADTVTVHYTIGGTAYQSTDDASGNITGTDCSGTVNYSTGAVSLTFTTAPDNGTDITNDYTYYFAPAAGQRITMDFSGFLKVHCRFADDTASFEVFVRQLRRGSLKLQGLLNA